MPKQSVTQILSQIYPMPENLFADMLSKQGLDKKRASGDILPWWIADKCDYLDSSRVMNMLTNVWKIVHACAYDYGIMWFCHDFKWSIAEIYVASFKKFVAEKNPVFVAGEIVVENDEYTGCADALMIIWWRLSLIDFKTWWAYKDIYWFVNKIAKPNGEPYSQSSNLKKTWLQLSMYQDAMTNKNDILDRYVLWLTPIWYYLFPVPFDLSAYIEWKSKPLTNLTLS